MKSLIPAVHREDAVGGGPAAGLRRTDSRLVGLGGADTLSFRVPACPKYCLTAGLLASVALTRFLATILYRGNVVDPLILTMTLAVLLSVVIVASLVPALRAMKVDPAVALRCE